MTIPKRRSLAGTNGIPLEEDRVYADDVVLDCLLYTSDAADE